MLVKVSRFNLALQFPAVGRATGTRMGVVCVCVSLRLIKILVFHPVGRGFARRSRAHFDELRDSLSPCSEGALFSYNLYIWSHVCVHGL